MTVDVATADSTADSGDYLPLAATVTFDPGQRSKTVTVKVLGDHYEITATVIDSEQLTWWLRSFGNAVQSISKRAIRAPRP